MQRTKSGKSSLIFIALILFGMLVFASVGMTFAYFQVEKAVQGEFKIGSVGAKWYNSTTLLTKSNVYNLAGTAELERGNTDGVNLVKADGTTAGGDLRLVADSNISGQYARVKPEAYAGKNLFGPDESFTQTSSGLSFEYSVDEDCLILNGTTTATAHMDDRWLNIPITKGTYYTISTNYISGTVTRPTNTHFASAFFGASDTINTNNNWLNCSLEEYNTNQNRVCNYNYITRFWFYISGGVTFDNYKVRIQLEEGSTATPYQKYIEREDVTSYLTFRYIASSTSIYTFGTNNFWKNGGDGWYYYINASTNNVLKAGNFSMICNNIVLSGEYPSRLLNQTITITFTFEVLQSANSPVASVWGESALTALGLS